jgi:hypothetical protein
VKTLALGSKCASALFIVGLVLAFVANGQAALIGYYALNETENPSGDTTAVDSSGAGHDGYYMPGSPNGPTVGVASANAGLYGTAVDFASADLDGVNIGNYAGALTSNFTVAAWVKPVSLASGRNMIVSGSNRNPGWSGWYMGVTGAGQLQFGEWGVDDWQTSWPAVPTGQWTHVAATVDSSSHLKLYVNGVEDTQFQFSAAAAVSTGPFTIGQQYSDGASGSMFNGSIDEVRIYSTALAGSEIAALAGVPEPSTLVLASLGMAGLLAYAWRKRK